MIYVYRGINRTKEEVYHGVSRDPYARRDGAHCRGATRAISHWDCDKDSISWYIVSRHYKQTIASREAHQLEKSYRHHKRFRNIQTSGI